MKTYVEFIRPVKGNPAGAALTREAQSRDPEKLDIPAGCDIFYFYDSPADDPGRAAEDQRDRSKLHIVAQRLVTRAEAKRLIMPGASRGELARIIWDARLENNRLFALTRNDNLEVVHKDNIVVDARGRQIWPKPRKVRAPKDAFNFRGELDHDLDVEKPPLLKPPQP